jgi:uncharacterized phage-associated protein
MASTYSAKAVANFFLRAARRDGVQLSQMKLQKLVYFAQGWHLGIRKTPLFEEPIQAWKYGPVVPSLYREFKNFGNAPIESLATDFDWADLKSSTPQVLPEDKETIALLEKVWSVYSKYTAIQLSDMSHVTGGPWEQVGGGNAPTETVIPDQSLQDYFSSLATGHQS